MRISTLEALVVRAVLTSMAVRICHNEMDTRAGEQDAPAGHVPVRSKNPDACYRWYMLNKAVHRKFCSLVSSLSRMMDLPCDTTDGSGVGQLTNESSGQYMMKFRSSASPCGLDPSPSSNHHFRMVYTMDVENTCLLGGIDGFATSGTCGRSSERMHGRNRVYIL